MDNKKNQYLDTDLKKKPKEVRNLVTEKSSNIRTLSKDVKITNKRKEKKDERELNGFC